jgi:hypothetical protein
MSGDGAANVAETPPVAQDTDLTSRSTPPLTPGELGLLGGAGVVTAVALPFSAIGSGIALIGLVVAAVVLVERPLDSWDEPWQRAAVACAVVAAPLPAVSDAGWVVGPVLLVALALAVVALAGGTGWYGLARPLLGCVPGSFRSVAAVARSVRRLVPPGPRVGPALRAATLTTVVVAGFGALFVSADRLFGELVERFLLPDVDLPTLVLRLGAGAVVTVGVATVASVRPRPDGEPSNAAPARTLRGVEWLTPLVGLVALFTAFVVVQFGVLFGGHMRVLRTAGLTYAEYARSGFAQLVVVALLTLGVVVGVARYAPARGLREVRLRRWLLAALCALTLVVLASAHHRLALYEEAFGYTRLRFGARATIWWLAVVFVLLLLAGAARRTRSLPRAVVLLTGVAVVATGYLQPDALIARRNVERSAAHGTTDVDYLAGLSADAVPALLALPSGVRGCALERQAARLAAIDEADERMSWNLSRARAVAALEVLPGDRACR